MKTSAKARGGGRLRKHDPALSFEKCPCQLCKAMRKPPAWLGEISRQLKRVNAGITPEDRDSCDLAAFGRLIQAQGDALEWLEAVVALTPIVRRLFARIKTRRAVR